MDYSGRFIEIQHSFWGLMEPPPHGSLNAVLGPHLRLCLAFGHTPEEIDAFYRRELPGHPDLSFSRRLSEDPEKVFRDELATARKIERDNGYQPDPRPSTAIFTRLAAAFRRRGLDPLDPTAFGQYRQSGKIDRTPHEVEFNEAAEQKMKMQAGWLHKDSEVVLRAARLVAGFVQANPGRQLAAVLVPKLCGDLPVKWLCDSDIKSSEVQEGRAVPEVPRGRRRAGGGQAAAVPGAEESGQPGHGVRLGGGHAGPCQGGGCQLLIAVMAACPAPWHDVLRRELRRLRRHRTCRHGPPGRRRVA